MVLYKIFHECLFLGEVVCYNCHAKLYCVKYEDGDQEELDKGDMGRIFIYKLL